MSKNLLIYVTVWYNTGIEGDGMMYRLRVVYGKSKDAMYISQDDTIKIFTDAFEKAMMPFVKSEVTGRIDINFAHPLTDGYTSTG